MSRPSRPRVVFIVQRCADDAYGGAERLCLETARHMSRHWDLEILTTCARDVRTWDNVYPEGTSQVEGVTVRRFRVAREREPARFNRLSARLAAQLPNDPAREREWMEAQGPLAPALRDYVVANRARFDACYVYSYLYATTYFSLPEFNDDTVLVPLAHDEWPLRMGIWDVFFRQPRTIVCVSAEERRLLQRRFRDLPNLGPVIPAGVEAPAAIDAASFRARYCGGRDYLLYLGRVEAAKGCDELLDDYLALPAALREQLPLVLAGPIALAIPNDPTVIAVGPLEETMKWSALAGCEALVVPSRFESLSLVALEAWAAGRPVLASGRSPVLIGQCRRSGGGLWYANRDEFLALVSGKLFGVADALGAQGRRYVAAEHRWEAIEAAHLSLIGAMLDP